MQPSPKTLLPLIARYQKPATRLASLQLKNKACAPDIITIILEELYDQELLFEGPHLRPLLLGKIRWACRLVNKLSAPANKYHPNGPLYQYPHHNCHCA